MSILESFAAIAEEMKQLEPLNPFDLPTKEDTELLEILKKLKNAVQGKIRKQDMTKRTALRIEEIFGKELKHLPQFVEVVHVANTARGMRAETGAFEDSDVQNLFDQKRNIDAKLGDVSWYNHSDIVNVVGKLLGNKFFLYDSNYHDLAVCAKANQRVAVIVFDGFVLNSRRDEIFREIRRCKTSQKNIVLCCVCCKWSHQSADAPNLEVDGVTHTIHTFPFKECDGGYFVDLTMQTVVSIADAILKASS